MTCILLSYVNKVHEELLTLIVSDERYWLLLFFVLYTWRYNLLIPDKIWCRCVFTFVSSRKQSDDTFKCLVWKELNHSKTSRANTEGPKKCNPYYL